jgi:hypothetical protein
MINQQEAPQNVVQYLILGLLKEWYSTGKTHASLHELYESLGVDYTDDEFNEHFEISQRVLEIEDELIQAGIGNHIQ